MGSRKSTYFEVGEETAYLDTGREQSSNEGKCDLAGERCCSQILE